MEVLFYVNNGFFLATLPYRPVLLHSIFVFHFYLILSVPTHMLAFSNSQEGGGLMCFPLRHVKLNVFFKLVLKIFYHGPV